MEIVKEDGTVSSIEETPEEPTIQEKSKAQATTTPVEAIVAEAEKVDLDEVFKAPGVKPFIKPVPKRKPAIKPKPES